MKQLLDIAGGKALSIARFTYHILVSCDTACTCCMLHAHLLGDTPHALVPGDDHTSQMLVCHAHNACTVHAYVCALQVFVQADGWGMFGTAAALSAILAVPTLLGQRISQPLKAPYVACRFGARCGPGWTPDEDLRLASTSMCGAVELWAIGLIVWMQLTCSSSSIAPSDQLAHYCKCSSM